MDDVQKLLEESAPAFHLLLDGISIAKRDRRDDLRDRCIQLAVASVTGEIPDAEIRNLAREAAFREVERVSEDSLHEDSKTAARLLRQLGQGNPRLASAMEAEVKLLDELALFLNRSTSPSFVSAAKNLRKLKRPDLALSLGSKSALRDPRNPAARTTMAGALIDLGRFGDAIKEARAGEELKPSSYTSSTLSRAHRVLEDLTAAIDWAEVTIRRSPESLAGYRALVAAAYAARDLERLERAREFLNREGRREDRSKEYVEFLTALEFVDSGETNRGLAILRYLASLGYGPARRKLLEYEVPRSRPTDGRPPR